MKMRPLSVAAALVLLFVAQQQLAAQQTASYPRVAPTSYYSQGRPQQSGYVATRPTAFPQNYAAMRARSGYLGGVPPQMHPTAYYPIPARQGVYLSPSPQRPPQPNSPATSTVLVQQAVPINGNLASLSGGSFSGDGKSDEYCGDCGPKRCFFTFGEVQYLRARNAEVTYAVETNGPIAGPPPPPPLQISRIALLDPSESFGYQVGFGFHLGGGARLVASYTQFMSNETGFITRLPANALQSMVLHPQSTNASTNFLFANASLDIDYFLVDVEFHGPWAYCDDYYIDWMAGFRYGRLNQEFNSTFANGVTENVATRVEFDGAGFRLGVDGEKFLIGGFTFYGEAAASFLAGVVDAQYRQTGSAVPLSVNTSWSAGRIVTILDIELGLAWTSKCERWKFKTGYLMSGWFNTVTTNEWIRAVQRNDFTSIGNGMSFDGLTASGEFRW